MTPIRFKLGFGLATLLAGATVAHAVPITLDLVAAAPKTLGPQSTSAPCIIAGTNCKNPADFPFTDFKQGGNIPAYDEDSPTYTIDQFPFLNFNVAIDVNTNSDAGETLQMFSVFVDADGDGAGGFEEIYNFTGPALIGDAVQCRQRLWGLAVGVDRPLVVRGRCTRVLQRRLGRCHRWCRVVLPGRGGCDPSACAGAGHAAPDESWSAGSEFRPRAETAEPPLT